MTKLGITPGVHGEDQLQKEDELTTVKIDPKVFTILQPVGTPPPTVLKAPLREQVSLFLLGNLGAPSPPSGDR